MMQAGTLAVCEASIKKTWGGTSGRHVDDGAISQPPRADRIL